MYRKWYLKLQEILEEIENIIQTDIVFQPENVNNENNTRTYFGEEHRVVICNLLWLANAEVEVDLPVPVDDSSDGSKDDQLFGVLRSWIIADKVVKNTREQMGEQRF